MPFSCEYCQKSFTIASLLRKHTRVFHPEVKRTVLQDNIGKVSKFQIPKRYVIKWSSPGFCKILPSQSFSCEICKACFESGELLHNHKKKCGKSSRGTPCKGKGDTKSKTSESRTRSSAVKINFRDLLQCVHCAKQFSSIRTLECHVKRYHPSSKERNSSKSKRKAASFADRHSEDESKPTILENIAVSFNCEKCDRQFSSDRGLRCHVRVFHGDEKMIDDTNHETRETKLQVRLKQVKIKKSRSRKTNTSCICEKCGKVFATVLLLRKHNRVCCIEADISVITSKLRPLMPKLCEASCDGISSDNEICLYSKFSSALTAQENENDVDSKQEISIYGNADSQDGLMSSSSALFQCDYCKKCFTSKLMLSNHIKVFHQAACSTSPMQQSQVSQLHIESTVKPSKVNKKIQCFCCKAKFSVYSELSEHFRMSHPGIKISGDHSEIPNLETRPPLLQWTNTENRDALECPYCHRHLLKNSSLRRHVKKIHPGADLPQCRTRGRKLSPDEAQQRQIVNCSECEKFFYSKRGLRLHRKKVHGTPEGKSRFIFSKSNMYGQGDLTDVEGIPLYRDLQFESLLEFQQWKAEEESNSVARFNKVRRDQRNGDGSLRRTYVCHRSGKYIPQGRGVRRIKLQGSAKIGTRCPASIYLKYYPNGKAMARYFPKHEGHECDPVYLLKKRERKNRGIKISVEASSRRQMKAPRVNIEKNKEIAEEHVMAIQSALEGCSPDVMKSICDQLSQIRALMSTTVTTTAVSQPIATTMQATTVHDMLPQIQIMTTDIDARNNMQYFFPTVSEDVLSFISL